MKNSVLIMESFRGTPKAGNVSWNLSTGLTPNFTTDATLTGATTAFNKTVAANQDEYSDNSSFQVSGIDIPIAIRITGITPSANTFLYGRVSTSSFTTTNLRTANAVGWVPLSVGQELSFENGNYIGFGVFKQGHDDSVSVGFLNATVNASISAVHVFS